jgi:hypothetical protein
MAIEYEEMLMRLVKRLFVFLLLAAAAVAQSVSSEPASPNYGGAPGAMADELRQLREALAAQQAVIAEQQRRLDELERRSKNGQLATVRQSADVAPGVEAAPAGSVPQGTSRTAPDQTTEQGPLSIRYKGITFTPGGFLAAESVYRSHGLGADVNTPFNGIPFSGSNAAHLSEWFGSGRQSRLTLLAEGKLSRAKLTGYYEMDWLSAGTTSNNNQSNSYTNRQRQIWGQAALNSGWSFTGGQMWSLVTETKKGLDNRTEALPMTIDAQYHVGFSWARQFGFRVVKNFADRAWFGFAVENPQMILAAHGNASNFVAGQPGTAGGLYNPTANYSLNAAPDFVAKLAFEPGWGHYEVFGVLRTFRDRVYPGATSAPATAAGAFNDHAVGGGVGINARGTIAKRFDVGLLFLGGDGIGRYGTSTLPDATVHPDGTLALIHSFQALGTVEYHSSQWDVYWNAGAEYAARTYYRNASGNAVGYGAPTFLNSGCAAEVLPAGGNGFGAASPANCTGDTRNVVEGTFGFWYKPYSGSKGRIQFGPQYSYVVRNAWSGAGAKPKAVENMLFTSFRYYLP